MIQAILDAAGWMASSRGLLVHAGQEAPAAHRRHRVHEHQRVAPVELLHHRREGTVTQPFVAVAREKRDAVDLERVEPIFYLDEALRQRCR
jgi:hypothetical protein